MTDNPNQADQPENNPDESLKEGYEIPDIEDFGDDVIEGQTTSAPVSDLPTAGISTPSASNLALVSMISGILGLTLLPFLGSIIAVFTGHMARKEIRESNNTISGDNFATAGLVLGYIGVGLGLIALCCAAIIIAISFFTIVSSESGAFHLILQPLI